MKASRRGVARAIVVVVVLAAGMWAAAAQQKPVTKASQSADALLGAALHQEEVAGQLEAAIATYRQVLKAPDATREQQARAQFRIGVCYERLGNAEARKAYEEVVRTFADQAGLAAQARARLGALTQQNAAAAPAMGPTTRLLHQGRKWDYAALSPDGRSIAYLTITNGVVGVLDLTTGNSRVFVGPPKGQTWDDWGDAVRWSRDGRSLAVYWYVNDGESMELRIVDVSTGSYKTVPGSTQKGGFLELADWSADGTRLLAAHEPREQGLRPAQLVWLPVAGGEWLPVVSIPADRIFFGAKASPDGRSIAYETSPRTNNRDRDIFVVPATGGTSETALAGPSDERLVAWSPDGSGLVFHSNRSDTDALWLQRLEGGKPTGEPTRLREPFEAMGVSGLSDDGTLLYETSTNVWSVHIGRVAAGNVSGDGTPVAREDTAVSGIAWSRDGRMLAWYDRRAPQNSFLTVWSADTRQSRRYSLPFAGAGEDQIRWSEDERHVFVVGSVPRQGSRFDWAVHRVNVETGQTTASNATARGIDVLGSAAGYESFMAISPDGNIGYKRINYGRPNYEVGLAAVDLETGAETLLYKSGPNNGMTGVALSPDGSRLAFRVRDGLSLVPSAGGPVIRPCPSSKKAMRTRPWWAPDGTVLYSSLLLGDLAEPESRSEIWGCPVGGGEPVLVASLNGHLVLADSHPDGTQIAYVVRSTRLETYLLENFLPAAAKAGHRPPAPARR